MMDNKDQLAKLALPKTIPFLSKSGQLLLPKGLLPVLIKIPADIYMVEHALRFKRYIGIIQPLKEFKTQKELYAIGCVGRITTFSENEDGSLYIIIKGIQRFRAMSQEGAFLKVDYDLYHQDRTTLETSVSQGRDRLMGLLKTYFNSIHMDINWSDINEASDETLTTSLAMVCPFEAREKQAILESKTVEERLEMITAFIELTEMKKSPVSGLPH